MSGRVLRPNLFGIPFGLAGLAACWSAAGEAVHALASVAGVLWAIAAAVWLLVVVPYGRQVLRDRGLRRELADPVFGPFTSVPALLVMLLGSALSPWSRSAGTVVFVVGLVATLLVGGYLTGQWILEDLRLAQWHPGYFLPTVGGGLLAANVSARLGLGALAFLMFGYGLICWFVLGSIILARLFSQPMLPAKLRPTLAIELAPPAVAGNAWLAMHGGRLDLIALMLAGYGLLMVLVQVRLAPLYVRVPFGPGSWAFAFSYLQAVTFGVHWASGTDVPAGAALIWLLLGISTVGVLLLGARTVQGLARRTFLPTVEPA